MVARCDCNGGQLRVAMVVRGECNGGQMGVAMAVSGDCNDGQGWCDGGQWSCDGGHMVNVILASRKQSGGEVAVLMKWY